MSLFVDTSVWSLALRRDAPPGDPQVAALTRALTEGQAIVATGLVLQELLQGFVGPKSRALILEHFSSIPLVVPDRDDHIQAAELRNTCRRAGTQVGTIDALIAQICIRHTLTLLSTDKDFERIAGHTALRVWRTQSAT